MVFSLSTRWNAGCHDDGETMIKEILDLGFDHVELSYDLTLDLVPGVRDMVASGAVNVTSIHAFCPVPIGAPCGHPELFSLTEPDERRRGSAVLHTIKNITFAAEVGASTVVSHAGRVTMRAMTPKLIDLAMREKHHTPRYEKAKFKLLDRRARHAAKYVDALYFAVEELLPDLERHRVCLAFENLPYWEAVPSEMEMRKLLDHFDSPWVGYWHDTGHGQIRENLGLINQKLWFDRLSDRLSGIHVHDTAFPAGDHLMPPQGSTDFSIFRKAANSDISIVLEPMPRTPPEDIRESVQFLQTVWRSVDREAE